MKIVLHIIAAGFLILAPLYGETLDKIVAVVDDRIITSSDIQQEHILRNIFGETTITDDAIVQQLIEASLIEGQLADFPGTDVEDEEVTAAIAKLQKTDGVTSNVLRAAILRRIRTARYFDVRFRQFLRPSDEDVQKYYDSIFVPAATARGMNPVPDLEKVIDSIRQNVLEEQLDREVGTWLEAVRRRSNIEILK